MNENWKKWEQCVVALTAWREASNQSRKCRQAIMCCIRNRVRNPKWWGNDWISVCTKREQFTSMNTKIHDPNLVRWPQCNDHIFEECLDDAELVMGDKLMHPFPGADSYYDDSIPVPYWAKGKVVVGREGKITFYNIDGDTED